MPPESMFTSLHFGTFCDIGTLIEMVCVLVLSNIQFFIRCMLVHVSDV